eukprot:11197870-Lingulodinium_polyedra.AAC.1
MMMAPGKDGVISETERLEWGCDDEVEKALRRFIVAYTSEPPRSSTAPARQPRGFSCGKIWSTISTARR